MVNANRMDMFFSFILFKVALKIGNFYHSLKFIFFVQDFDLLRNVLAGIKILVSR